MTPNATDADATRGAHFAALARHPFAIAGTVVAVALAAAVGGALAGLAPGLGAGVGALLLAALTLFVIADAKAADDFYRAYAASRSLTTGGGRGQIPGSTALLRKGLRRYTERAFAGRLAGRAEGLLALYTYETETTDSKGRRQTHYHHFTVALVAVPEAVSLLRECACQRRAGFRFFDGAEDAFRSRQRVELESEEVDRRYEIFIGEDDDQNRARQLFSPSFVDWLATGDDDMGWELEGGMLAVNVPGHKDSAAELDAVCAAAATVAERISEEAAEGAGGGARRAPGQFAPASLVVAEESGGVSASLKRRLWALFLLLCTAGGIAIGFASGGDGGGSGGTSFDSGPAIEYSSSQLEAQDAILLPAIARLDRGGGVHTDDLYGQGVPRAMVGQWITDAFVRDLIDLDAAKGTFALTRQGKREAGG